MHVRVWWPAGCARHVCRYAPFLQYDNLVRLPDYEIPATRVSVGTYPKGSQWTRNPVPGCYFCDQAECMRNYTKFMDQQVRIASLKNDCMS
jgi:hypothetical protein